MDYLNKSVSDGDESLCSNSKESSNDEDEEVPDLIEFMGDGEAKNEDNILESNALAQKAAGNGTISIVPVTIITGFLGSGKSTLLRYILSANHGLRIAVIENEFGDSMEIENIIATDGSDGQRIAGVFELRNGCVCCSVKDDLVSTLDYLLEQREKAGLAFDRVLIETTGLANPGPVASVLWVDEELESRVCLDGIVTLVDSKNITRHLDSKGTIQKNAFGSTSQDANELHGNEARMQIAYADRVILNKTDLVNPEELVKLHEMVQAINKECEIVETSHSRVSLDWVLLIKTLSTWTEQMKSELDSLENPDDSQTHPAPRGSCCNDCIPDQGHPGRRKGCKLHDTVHDPLVTTESFVVQGQITEINAVEMWLGHLLWDKDTTMEIYRMKGLFTTKEQSQQYVLQAVYDLFEITPCQNTNNSNALIEEDIAKAEAQSSYVKIVVIGRLLDRARIENGLMSCIESDR